jgi:8-oxo-dGTP diphosphatase
VKDHKQRIVVAGFIQDEGKVLLAKRATTKALAPGKYHLPGGHVEFGETVQAALAREIAEEFGVRVEVREPFFAFSYVTGEIHTIGVVCLARLAEPRANIRLKLDETAEYVWAGADELGRYLAPEDYNLQAALAGFGRAAAGASP